MNRLFWYVRGYLRVDIHGVSLDRLLNTLAAKGCAFWDPVRTDEFSITISVFRKDISCVEEAVQSAQCVITQAQPREAGRLIKAAFHRAVLLCGLVLGLATILIGQNFLMFYSVSGSETVPGGQILQVLEELGVGFGTVGTSIRPKWIKDHVLSVLPQLQWITVTQNGSVAEVVVRDRPEIPQIQSRKGLANIVASRSGIILQQQVFSGQALKQIGDVVTQGDMLVSGVVDLERIYSIVYSRAEIYARTWHSKSVVVPEIYADKEYRDGAFSCIWLEIGKRRIKIFGNSGISHAACDKMIDRKYLTLPGGYQLPVALVTERFEPYTAYEVVMSDENAQTLLRRGALKSVKDALYAGEVLKQTDTMDRANGAYILHADFECKEMIAKTVEGIWNEEDFVNDRKNSERGAN